MCGRYTLRDPKAIAEAISQAILIAGGLKPEQIPQRFNAAPSQALPVVIVAGDQPRVIQMRWGILPFYARQEQRPTRLINARSETAIEKPAFKQSLQQRRCLVPADGFFEWRRTGTAKQPYFFRRKNDQPFFLAGIFEDENPPHDPGYCLLTTTPNELVQPIHDRMPVIFTPALALTWLQPGIVTGDQVRQLCSPFPANDMVAAPVNPVVNNARYDGPECVVKVD